MLSTLSSLTHAKVGVLNPEGFPHLWQGETENPQTHCFPAAMSNILMAVKPQVAQLKPLTHLGLEQALAHFMQTDRKGLGTELDDCLEGLAHFLEQHAVPYKRIVYHGALNAPQQYQLSHLPTEGQPPSLASLKAILAKGEPCMSMLGWYYYNPQEGLYRRYGSHAVTIVGIEESVLTARKRLLVRDPNITFPNPWHEPLLLRLPLKPLKQNDTLYAKNSKEETAYFPLKTKGFYAVSRRLPMKPQGTVAILEGFLHIEGLANKKWIA